MGGRRRSSLFEGINHENDDILRVRDDSIRRLSQAHGNIASEAAQARLATEFEKSLTVRNAVKLYKKAIIYSLIMSLAVVMEG